MSTDSAEDLIPACFAAGTVIGGYGLERRLGQGGMASVFLATDIVLGRRVALKVLSAEVADRGFRQRFVREPRLAAAVDDPHIIPIYEAGEDDGVLYIAMRYVPGGDARTLLRRSGRLSPARAAAIISPVASALDAAHGAGLVHRDVKPANILIDARPGRPDHVYLADFGISKPASPTATALTGTGKFVGTLNYVAPEQIRAQALTGTADQYSLACTAFELLTGQLPFGHADPMALIAAHLLDPAPAISARDVRLAAADPVFARALAKDPATRYLSCRDFADDLRSALGLAPFISADPPPEPVPARSPAPGGEAGVVQAAKVAARRVGTGRRILPSRLFMLVLAAVVAVAVAGDGVLLKPSFPLRTTLPLQAARHAPSARSAPVQGRKVMAVGDSVMLASAPELAQAMPGIYINAMESRAMIGGVGLIQRLAASHRLRHVVVVGLGANGPISAYQIAQLRAAIGPSRWLLLINTFVPHPWEREVNTTLARAASRYHNVLLVNWHAAIEHHTNLLWSDGIHPQPIGGKLYANVVRAMVLYALRTSPLAK